jgi:two-component system sensor histidine kinase KdpD
MNKQADRFIDLIRKSKRGKFKIYIGMSAGVGKTYRMLQEMQVLLRNGIDVKIGYIETHKREETHALLGNLPQIPRRKLFYKGKELEEMDLQAILNLHPEVVIVDELAHSNIEGSKNEKRWQDVIDLLDAGINVISALNIQHIESLNEEAQRISGINIKERVPDSVLQMADEVVNIDLTADELIQRLKDGKIYDKSKIELALGNFFKEEKILQLRELALKEVAHQLERKIDLQVPKDIKIRTEKFLACISSNDTKAKIVIRKTARLASYYRSKWIVVYVQTNSENSDNIKLNKQRFLINNFKLVSELGGELVKVEDEDISLSIFNLAVEKEVSTICMGKPKYNIWKFIFRTSVFGNLLKLTTNTDIDLVILS